MAKITRRLWAEEKIKQTKLQDKLRELNSLYRAAQMMTSLQDLNRLLDGIVHLAAGVLRAKTASLMLLDDQTNELRIVACKGLDEETASNVRMKIGESIAGYVVEYGKPLLVKNVEKDSRFQRRNRERYETKSLISVPLETKGKILGVLNLNNKRSGQPFTADDLRLLVSFAAQAAVAVDNVRLLEQNRRKIQELSILNDIARQVGSVDGLRQAVENVFDGICRIVSVDHCYWFLWEERYHRLSLAFAMLAGHPVSQWAEGREIYLSDELLQQIQAGQRERLNRTVRDTLAEWGLCPADVRYFNSFAIVVRGKIHGLFCAASSSLEDISPDEVQLISIIISQAASLYEQHAALSSATLVMTMSKVASEIAHDLRHPLTNIKGILQVLETKWYDSDFRQESFQLIHREIYRLTELTKELVRFANPNRFQAKYQDVHRILDRALDLVKNELSRGRIQLDTQYHQNLPPAYVDENEILETFLNLLLNSIESMPDGGVLTISTDLRQHLKDDSGTPRTFLQVSITDTGRGIAPEHRDHIFERYFTTKKNGTGLGLSIANRIVAAYHGFIEVHSVPDQGSTFSVHLPV